MKLIETGLAGVKLIEPEVFGDYRGWFTETWSEEKFRALGIELNFVQDNESYTAKKGTVRGLHFQNGVWAQAKVVRVLAGAVMDVAVDLRRGSPQYLQWFGAELSGENKRQLLIPRGFAHGFVTLTDGVLFAYKVDNAYNKESDRSVRFDDASIGVKWGVAEPILSDKDKNAPLLCDSDCNFVYNG